MSRPAIWCCLLSFAWLTCPEASTTARESDRPAANSEQSTVFTWDLRTTEEVAPESGRFHQVERTEIWLPSKTAFIVCDMWDLHHCLNATRRVGELAPRMNRVLNEARRRGATIIHSPSSCMDAYADHPARRHAQETPRVDNLPPEIGSWCHSIPAEEQGVYPIDQSDGGEDDDLREHEQWAKQLTAMGRNPGAPWKTQTSLLDIHDEDFISDDGEEVWSILEQRGINNVVLVGVHTNMCVLGRPFGLRQMARNGKNVVLMRDMTDTMYNPAMPPFVSHFTGTDLIVEHIEKYVCPTVTSDQILGGEPFRFRNDTRPHLVIVMAEKEYHTAETLPAFAKARLGKEFRVSYVYEDPDNRNTLPGIEVLDEADVALISVRRRHLPPEQMEVVRQFVHAGKPVVGIRTANHAFCLRNSGPEAGLTDWRDWDPYVFGGHYTNHHGDGPDVDVRVSPEAAEHPILTGVDVESLRGKGSLYQVNPLSSSTFTLLTGTIPGKPTEPLAWTNITPDGGPSFYTSLGHVGDFEQPEFQDLLHNALRWAAGIPISARQADEGEELAAAP